MEIERKFLITRLPFELSDLKYADIIQFYLTDEGISPERRIRQASRSGESKYYLTEKNIGGMIREEIETEISCEEYLRLKASAVTCGVEKTRYFIPLDNKLTAELDVYRGSLSGLVTVEVEFGSSDEALAFSSPSWFGNEITDDKRYKNRSLALRGLPVNHG